MNDHPPIFNQTIYRRAVREDERPGGILLRVVAFDRDEGANAELSFTFDDPTSTFAIDRRNGEISLRKSLDFERRRSFVLPVTGQFAVISLRMIDFLSFQSAIAGVHR